jgi:dihydrodipicolinate synthase/N-acetylneuraminate lyase
VKTAFAFEYVSVRLACTLSQLKKHFVNDPQFVMTGLRQSRAAYVDARSSEPGDGPVLSGQFRIEVTGRKRMFMKIQNSMNRQTKSEKGIDRRLWLKCFGGALTLPVLLKSPFTYAEERSLGSDVSLVSPATFRSRMKGPICSIPTVYNADFSIDHQGIRQIVESGVKSGCGTFAMTSGNSQYDKLTYDEIKQLTRTMIEAVAGRGLTIAATGAWWTGQAVDYARYAKALGADAVQVMLPGFGEQDLIVSHYSEIAKAGPPSIVLHGQVPMPLLEQLVGIDAVSAYKEEYPPMYSRDVFDRFGKRLNIFAGGQMGGYLMYRPYGMKAWYCTFSTFAPKISRLFAEADRNGSDAKIVNLIQKYDVPFFRKFSHAFWRGAIEASGVAKRWLRPPDRSFTDDEVKKAGRFLAELGA